MTRPKSPKNANSDSQIDAELARSERWELLGHIQAALEPIMVGLGLVFLALLLVDYASLLAGTGHEVLLSRSLVVIWAVFLADFAIRLAVAPHKLRFLRANWLTIVSLALPFLRPIRALRALRAVRSIRLVRLIGGVNRGMRVVRRISRGQEFAYVGGLTLLVVAAGAVGVWFFDRGDDGATIVTIGDAFWWSSTLITTMNNELYPVTVEARILAVLMRIYAVSVFGFITATIASYLVGQRIRPRANDDHPPPDLDEQLAMLHEELQSLRRELNVERKSASESASA